MRISDGFTDAIGNTPLIRLRRLSEESGCEILGKAEFMNPGGSVKDRAASAIVADYESRGQLPPGGTVVEGTAGPVQQSQPVPEGRAAPGGVAPERGLVEPVRQHRQPRDARTHHRSRDL